MSIDDAKKNFDTIFNDKELLQTIITEADTRLKLIDDIIVKVLDWNKKQIFTEEYTEDGGYIDYLMKINSRNCFIIEAKKTSNELWDLCDKSLNSYNISGPALKKALKAIEQARNYAINKSVGNTVVTNGTTWIGFLGIRTDGVEWPEGKAIVFPNLESIENNFEKFYELFSKNGILSENLKIKIQSAEAGKGGIPPKVLKLPYSKKSILVPRSPLAHDIESVFNKFFDKITDEDDSEMLEKCFVESKESQSADATLRSISENLIADIDKIDTKTNQLSKEIEETIETKSGRTVLIIGNKGSGKTTYIKRFFNIVLEPALKKKCLILNVDIGVSPGNLNFPEWITSRLIEQIHKQLFRKNRGEPDFNDLKGIYNSDYYRFKTATFKCLYENDRYAFDIRFGEFLEKERENTFEYLIKILQHVVSSRKRVPCIVFDNLDHHEKSVQDEVFQYAQAIRDKVLSFTLCPITDKTIWVHSKSGPMQSFVTTVLYLPAPPTKEIIQSRLEYMKNKIKEIEHEEKRNCDQSKYFFKSGIKLNIKKLNKFVSHIQETFINTEFTAKIIGKLTNYSVRKCLLLSRSIMTSPVITPENLFSSTFSEKSVISLRNIEKAIIMDKCNIFDQGTNNYILNLFTSNPENYATPLLKLRILSFLKYKNSLLKNTSNEVFISIDDVYNFFYSLGLNETCIKQCLQEFLEYGLIGCLDASVSDINCADRICLNPCGTEHFNFATHSNVYLFNMALRTPILVNDYFYQIQELTSDNYISFPKEVISAFVEYCIAEDQKYIQINTNDEYKHQLELCSLLQEFVLK